MAAKSKARTMIIRLISTAQTGFFYTTKRVRQGPRLSAVKYDPWASEYSLWNPERQRKREWWSLRGDLDGS